MLEEILLKDNELLLLINQAGSAFYDPFWIFVSHKFGALPLYVFLLGLSVYHFGWKQTLWVLIGIALVIVCTDQTSNLFKYGFERLRPCHDPILYDKMRILSCGGKFGYFSAHAANTMAVACYFGRLFSWKKGLFVGLVLWSLLVGYSRLYLGVHFPTDVLTGFAIGGAFGTLFAHFLQKIANIKRIK